MSMLNNLSNLRREYPSWNTQAKIRKVDQARNVLQGQFAFGGEIVRVSPRYQRNGTNFRVRPERPAVFFSAWAFENHLLPTQLTPEEAESEGGLAILQPLFDTYKHYFPKLESPYAACDLNTEPSLKVGFSFNIPQVLVEQIGSVKPSSGSSITPQVPGPANNSGVMDLIKAQIEAMRARTTTSPSSPLPSVMPKTKKQ